MKRFVALHPIPTSIPQFCLRWLVVSTWLLSLGRLVLPLYAAPTTVYTVTKTTDTADGTCDADCSLREAVIAANQDGVADTIQVPSGIYTLTITGAGGPAATGDLEVINPLTILGAGSANTVIVAGFPVTDSNRLFNLSTQVVISGVTIMSGSVASPGGGINVGVNAALTLTNSTVRNNSGTLGGGLYSNGGNILLDNSLVVSNTATTSGGGLYNTTGSIALTNNSQVISNTANNDGGGLYITGQLHSTSSQIGPGNTTNGSGGGMYLNTGATANFTNTLILSNTASNNGGGVNNNAGTLIMADGEIQSNIANGTSGGGGVRNNTGGLLQLTGVTLANNKAQGSGAAGGGLLISNSALASIADSAFISNTASGTGADGGAIGLIAGTTLTLTNTDILSNTAADNGGGVNNTGGTINVTGGNLQGNTAQGNSGGGGGFRQSGGIATLNGVTLHNNTSTGNNASGGGLLASGGLITITASAFTNNAAAGNSGDGGGAAIINTASLSLTNTSLTGNSALDRGGGLYVLTATVELNTASASANTAGMGGGLFADAASALALTSSTFGPSNSAGAGAGLYVTATASATLVNTALYTNTATNHGGGGYNAGTFTLTNGEVQGNSALLGGGGLYNTAGGLTTLSGVTLTANTSTGVNSAGGGLLNASGNVAVTSSTFVGNSATGLGADGGGAAITGTATITITTSTFTANSAADAGGGAYALTGTLLLNNTHFLTNTASTGGGLASSLAATTMLNGGLLQGNNATGSIGGGGAANLTGTLTINNATIQANTAGAKDASGGGLLNAGGWLTITTTTLGPANSAYANGGGLAQISTGAVSLVSNSVITGNTTISTTSGGGGGGFSNRHGEITLAQSLVSHNSTLGNNGGGGLHNESGSVTVTLSTLAYNTAGSGGDGGGIANLGGATLTILTSTLHNNATLNTGSGGGLDNNASTVTVVDSAIYSNTTNTGSGGGIDNGSPNAQLRLSNVTLSGNRTTFGSGGGLRNTTGGTATLANVTIKDNLVQAGGSGDGLRNSGTAIVRNTLLVNNGAGNCSNDSGSGGVLTSQGFNLRSDSTCNVEFNATGDFTSNTPLVAPLLDNTGPTLSHALLSGSPAINAGNNTAGCLDASGSLFTSDQRGYARPSGGRCDIGAYEFTAADLTVSKSNDLSGIVPGTTVTYTILVSNTSPEVTVNNAPFTDTVPALLTNLNWNCTASAGANCDTPSGNGNAIALTVDLGPQTQVTLTVSGYLSSSITSGSITNTAFITVPIGIYDVGPLPNSATDADPITPQADLSLSKTDNQTSDIPGTGVVYTITVGNAGPSDVTNATVTDTLPVSVSGATWTCTPSGGAACGTPSGNGTINTTVTLPANTSATFVLTGSIASNATSTLTNTAAIATPVSVTDSNPSNNTATDTTTLTPTADLNISTTDGQITGTPGALITYTLHITNAGPSVAVNALVTDTFPTQLGAVTWSCAASSGSACPANGSDHISATVTLLVNGTATFTATSTIPFTATGVLINRAAITPAPGTVDNVISNNSALDVTSLNPTIDLSLSKTDGQTTAIPGIPITYTIVVANSGEGSATDAVITDSLPVSLLNASWTCTANLGSQCDTPNGVGDVTLTVDLAALTGTVTVTVHGTLDPAATGSFSNTATVTPSVFDVEIGSAPNTATDTDTLTPQVDLLISKTDNLTEIPSGTTLTYTVIVSNTGPSTAASTLITDILPTEFQNATWVCIGFNGATCPASGSGDLTSSVSLPPNSHIIIQITGTVVFTVAGTLTNTAEVAPPVGVTDINLNNNTATDLTVVSVMRKLYLPIILR